MRRLVQLLAFLLASVLTVQVRAAGGARWHCHPRGGSCVAAEAGAKTPYPAAERRLAWVYFTAGPRVTDRGYAAFTTKSGCEQARAWDAAHRRPEVTTGGRCARYGADDVLFALERR